MARQKQTMNVGEMLFMCNSFMQRSRPEQVGERKGHQSLMESVLHKTGNYRGFGYLDMTPKGDGTFNIPDESRVVMYIHPNLMEDYKAAEQRAKEVWG
jgi:hypothetical protein